VAEESWLGCGGIAAAVDFTASNGDREIFVTFNNNNQLAATARNTMLLATSRMYRSKSNGNHRSKEKFFLSNNQPGQMATATGQNSDSG